MEENYVVNLVDDMWCAVFKFLDFEKLKECRLVSHRWDELISGSLSLKKTAVLHITDENLSEIKKYISQSITLVNYRNLKISIACSDDDLSDLQYVLSRIGTDVVECRLEFCYAGKLDNLHLLLPKLQCLQIRWVDVNLRGLNRLKTLCFHWTWDKQLIELIKSPLQNLESLLLANSFGHETLICNVLKTYAKSLRHLTIFLYYELISNDSFKEIWPLMTKLQSITLINMDESSDSALIILNGLSKDIPLQKIKLFNELSDETWWQLINTIASKWPQTLQILCLSDPRNSYELRQFSHPLQKIENCDVEVIESILSSPKSDFPLRFCGIYIFETEILYSGIEALPNLVFLNLTWCFSSVTDTLLEYIFQYLTNLQTLILNGSDESSDHGFMGYGEDPYSVERLHRLQHLDLHNFPNITDMPLCSKFKFSELRILRLSGFSKITAVGLDSVVKYCPALMDLKICMCPLVNKQQVINMIQDMDRTSLLYTVDE